MLYRARPRVPVARDSVAAAHARSLYDSVRIANKVSVRLRAILFPSRVPLSGGVCARTAYTTYVSDGRATAAAAAVAMGSSFGLRTAPSR